MARILIPILMTDLVSTNVGESSLPEWTAGTAYTTGQEVKHTVGQQIPYQEYRARINHTASASAPPKHGGNSEWIALGAVNRHRMFDDQNNSPTVSDAPDGSIVVRIDISERRQVLSLMGLRNVDHVLIEQEVDGVVVETESLNLVSNQREPGWWTWLFGQDEKTYVKSVTYRLKGNYRTQSLIVTLSPSTGPAECSQCKISSEIDLGVTLEGAAPRIKKWSTFKANEIGVYTFVPRKGTRTGSYTLLIDTNYVDTLFGIMEDVEERLVILDANNEDTSFDSIRAYGGIVDFAPSLEYGKTRVDIKIEGIH